MHVAPQSRMHCTCIGVPLHHLVLELPHLQCTRDKFPGLFRVLTMAQFLWQGDLVNISKFLCECLDGMLGADCDDQGQTFDQP